MTDAIAFTEGSDNIFADLGVPDADEHWIKAELVLKIMRIMRESRLTQAQTAKLIGIRQPEVSNMIRGRFESVSVEKLLRHLVALGQDVEIVVKPHPDGAPHAAELRVA